MPVNDRSRALLAAAVAIVAALHLVGLGGARLLEPDEGRYADVALGFLRGGSLVVPQANGTPFLDKPPLVCWAGALSMKLLGADALALRLVPALAGVLAALVAGAFAHACYGRGSWVAVLVYGCSPLAVGVGRTFTLDVPLAALVSLGVYMLLPLKEPPPTPPPRSGGGIGGGLLLGLATLVKGPVALGLGGLAVLAALVHARSRGEALRLLSPLPWLVALAVAAPWYVLVAREEPELARAFFLQENLLRFAGTAFEHKHGPLFFPVTLAWGLGGGTLAGVVLLATRPTLPRGATALVLWSALVVLFFSLSGTKVETYILPVFPALAGVLGGEIETAIAEKDGPVWRGLVASFKVFAACLALAAGGLALYAAGLLPTGLEYGEEVRGGVSVLGAAFAAGAVEGAFLLASARRPRAALLALGGALLLLVLAGLGCLERLSEFKSAGPAGDLVRDARARAPGERVASYQFYYRGLPFFVGEPVVLLGARNELKLEAFAKRPDLYMPDVIMNDGRRTFHDDCFTRAFLVASRPLLVVMPAGQRRPERFLDVCARAGVKAELRGRAGEDVLFEVVR